MNPRSKYKTWTPNHLTFTFMPFNFSSTTNALLDWINHGRWQYTKVAVTKPLPHYIIKGHISNLTQMLTKLHTCNSYIFDSVFNMDIGHWPNYIECMPCDTCNLIVLCPNDRFIIMKKVGLSHNNYLLKKKTNLICFLVAEPSPKHNWPLEIVIGILIIKNCSKFSDSLPCPSI